MWSHTCPKSLVDLAVMVAHEPQAARKDTPLTYAVSVKTKARWLIRVRCGSLSRSESRWFRRQIDGAARLALLAVGSESKLPALSSASAGRVEPSGGCDGAVK